MGFEHMFYIVYIVMCVLVRNLYVNLYAEAFVVCRDFMPPERALSTNDLDNLVGATRDYADALEDDSLEERRNIRFVSCGDLNGWDSDASYALPSADYRHLAPVAPKSDIFSSHA